MSEIMTELIFVDRTSIIQILARDCLAYENHVTYTSLRQRNELVNERETTAELDNPSKSKCSVSPFSFSTLLSEFTIPCATEKR